MSERVRILNPFDAMYEGTPPWEIGRPQGVLLELLTQGAIQGSVLDVGCGTGESALHLAKLGFEVTGLDASARAIELAQAKAKDRRLALPLYVGDALDLG